MPQVNGDMPPQDERKFTRIPFETEVTLSGGNTVITCTLVRDISLGGIFVLTERAIPVGQQCAITIELRGPASLLKVQVEGEVIRVDKDGAALVFTKIDSDSLVHLRHLIRIHAEDPQLIDQEYFSELFALEARKTPTP
jgi:hypothetical protein